MKKILVMGVALFLLHSIVRTAGQQASPTSLTALQKKGAAAAVLRGTITDDAGRAVAAALVQWTHGSESDTGLTDEDGKYAFAIPCHCGISPGGGGAAAFTVSLSVRANPYSPAGKSVQAASGQTANVDFRLVRKPGSQIGIVQGRITDSASGDGVAGAKVAITNAGGELTATTNADGNYTIAGVGFGSGLEIEVSTEVPPCLAPAERSLEVTRAVTDQSFSLPLIRTHRLKCPAKVSGFQAGGIALSANSSETGRAASSASPARISGVTPFGNPAPDAGIKWEQADTETIHGTAGGDIFNAGHVADVYPLKNGEVIAAADTGGIWLIPTKGAALPVGSGLNSINMTSLAQGPDSPEHFYAGTYGTQESPGGVLWETDTSSLLTLLAWTAVQPAPPSANCYYIYKVLVVGRKIVLACQSGIWWSEIPPAPSAHGTYRWKQAVGTSGLVPKDLQNTFSGLAVGPKEASGESTILATSWGGTAPHSDFFWGTWVKGDLVFQDSTVQVSRGKASEKFGRTSVASCAEDLTLMYAVAADSGDTNMAALCKSSDGGHSWSRVKLPPNPGQQGGYNNAIAVSPDCHAVAVGWESGTFVSYDAGGSWSQLVDPSGQYSSLHSDIHGLIFDPADPATLYIASDGGVASAGSLIAGGKPAFKSSYNRTLFNLQIYQAGASSQTNGLAAVALQDNGAVYGKLPGGWQHLTNCGCDGGGAKFLAASTSGGPGYNFLVLAEWGAPSWPWNWVASHSGNNPVYPFNSQQTIPLGSNTAGIASGPGVFFPAFPLAVVRNPHFAGTTRRLMYAVTAQGSTVYGTLAGTDGSNPSFQALGKVGKDQKVTALASDDGQEVLIGTDHGHIYQLTAPYTGATAIQMAMTAPGTGKGSIGGLMDAANVGYAIYNDSNSNGYVLLQQETWDQVGVGSLPSNLPFNAIEETDDVTRLFVASAASVYSSSTYGFKWMAAANGLPTIAKGNDLQVVTQPDGKKYVYLGTYGWSLWRARLP